MEKHYDEYTAGELLQDPYFLEWLQRPDAANDRFWERWLKEHPHRAAVVEEARQLYGMLHMQDRWHATAEDHQEVLEGILAQTGPAPRPVRRVPVLLKWVAAVLLAAGAGIGAYFWQQATAYTTISAGVNIRQATLPDGTQLVLNAHSSCRYKARELWLEGEAFLDVQQQTDQPFTVHLNDMEIAVLGTRFNVINTGGRQNVMLESGKVRVATTGASLVLQPGEIASLKGASLQREKANASLYKGWIAGRLHFDHTTLAEIIRFLEHAYGWQVQGPGSKALLNKEISGSISITDRQALLNTLSVAFNLNIEQQNNIIILTSK
jgi:transmembrane sensor